MRAEREGRVEERDCTGFSFAPEGGEYDEGADEDDDVGKGDCQGFEVDHGVKSEGLGLWRREDERNRV